MIENIRRDHPNYSLAMELLCLVQRRERKLADYAADLGCTYQEAVAAWKNLRALGVLTETVSLQANGHRGSERWVRVVTAGWREAVKMGQAYWSSVYGERKAVA
jgi:hypothetical protein